MEPAGRNILLITWLCVNIEWNTSREQRENGSNVFVSTVNGLPFIQPVPTKSGILALGFLCLLPTSIQVASPVASRLSGLGVVVVVFVFFPPIDLIGAAQVVINISNLEDSESADLEICPPFRPYKHRTGPIGRALWICESSNQLDLRLHSKVSQFRHARLH